RFTDTMIRAIVEEGRLSSAADTKYLTDVIIRRRDKVVAYWITQTNPLDAFVLRQGVDGAVLEFDNAAIRVGAAPARESYAAEWFAFDNTSGIETPIAGSAASDVPRFRVPMTAFGPRDRDGSRYAAVRIATIHPGYPAWAKPVVVTVRERGETL